MKIMFMINAVLFAIAAGMFFFAMILAFSRGEAEHVIVGVVLGLAATLNVCVSRMVFNFAKGM